MRRILLVQSPGKCVGFRRIVVAFGYALIHMNAVQLLGGKRTKQAERDQGMERTHGPKVPVVSGRDEVFRHGPKTTDEPFAKQCVPLAQTYLRIPMKTLFTLLFSIACAIGSVAQWELLTPIKNTSEFEDLVMVNDLVGYAADRPTRTILATEDGGNTWQRRQHLLGNNPLAIHMWDEERGIIVGNTGSTIRTTDGFRTVVGSSNPTYGHLNCVFFLNDTLGWVGTQSGRIYRSTNAGVSWSLMQSGQSTSNYITSIQFVDELVGYASCYGGGRVLKSVDGGQTWVSIAPVDLVFIRDLHFSDAMNGVAVGHAGHVIRTTDGGANWTFMPSNTTYNLVSLSVQGQQMVACGWWGRAIHSTNGGLTWTEQTFGQEHMSVSLTPSGFGLMGGIARIFRTTDFGATWTLFKDGTSSSTIEKISFANENIGVAGNGLRTTDGGRTWIAAPSGGLGVHINPNGSGSRGGSSGSFGRTTDMFETSIFATGPNMAIRCTWSMNETTHFVGGGHVNGGIYRTTNSGSSWVRVLDQGNTIINDLWFVNDTLGFAVGEDGNSHRTVDGGLTWQNMGGSGGHTIFFMDELYGWTKLGRTTDGGLTWTLMGGTPQSCKSIFFTSRDTGYAVSTTGQVVRSLNGGQSWAFFLAPPPFGGINDAAYVDGYIIIAGSYGDIYRSQRIGCSSTPWVPEVQVDGNTLCTPIGGVIQWYFNMVPIEGGTTDCIEAEQSGNYHVIVTDELNCTSTASAPVQVITTHVDNVSNSSSMMLYPNPVLQYVRLDRKASTQATVSFIDAQGRIVLVQRVVGGNTVFDVSDLDAGLYLVRVADERGAEVLRLVKE